MAKVDALQFDPQQMIVTLLAVRYLQEHGTPIIMTSEELAKLAKFTIRLEIVQPATPTISPIKCSLITVEDAQKFMQEMQRSKGK